MISRIIIQNFKSLKNIDLYCRNLNLLTGLNGMGKSSVLQSLLLLRQSYDKGFLKNDGLVLKGDLVNIGVGKDALYQGAEKEEIKFSIDFKIDGQGISKSWVFGYEENKEEDEYKYSDSDLIPYVEDAVPPDNLDSLPLFNSHLKYLHADRWIRDQYERSDFQVIRGRSVGIHGEYTPHFLTHYGSKKDEEVSEKLLYPGTQNRELEYQVSAWMNEVSPGTYVKSQKIKDVDAIKLRYEFDSRTGRSNEISPGNVGFGITYVLPIIVTLLSSRPGDIILIENPESHLHSRGQSAMGRLMALSAQAGAQLFIETHSDHILNGVCVAIHNGLLRNALSMFHFFHKNAHELESLKYEVPVGSDGKADDRNLRDIGVEGFFDQINKDLNTIVFTPPIQANDPISE